MTYKQIVTQIHDCTISADQIKGILAEIDKSLEDGEISSDDREALYNIACWVYKGKKDGSYARGF